MLEISLPAIPWFKQRATQGSSYRKADSKEDDLTSVLRDSGGTRRKVRILSALLTGASVVGAFSAYRQSAITNLWYAISESPADAVPLAASSVAIGTLANIMSGLSSSVPRAILISAGIGVVAFTDVYAMVLLVGDVTASGGFYLASYATAHGIFFSAALPILALALKKAVSVSNKATRYICDQFVQIREVSVAKTQKYLLPSTRYKPISQPSNNDVIEV